MSLLFADFLNNAFLLEKHLGWIVSISNGTCPKLSFWSCLPNAFDLQTSPFQLMQLHPSSWLAKKLDYIHTHTHAHGMLPWQDFCACCYFSSMHFPQIFTGLVPVYYLGLYSKVTLPVNPPPWVTSFKVTTPLRHSIPLSCFIFPCTLFTVESDIFYLILLSTLAPH